MFPDNFYPYGAMFSTVLLGLLFLAAFIKWPKLRLFDWRLIMTILILGNTLDYFSTWLFVSTQGVNAEANGLARELMHLGWGWFTLYKMLWLNILSVLFALISKRMPIFGPMPLALGTMLILTSIHNVIAYLRF